MTEAKTPKTARWVKILLGVSLSLNMLVIAAGIGMVWSFSDGRDRAGQRDRTLFVPMIRALPRADREALRQSVGHRSGEGERGTQVNIRQSLLDALRSDPFDISLLETILNAEADGQNMRMEAGRAALLAKIAGMDAQERAAYSDRIEAILERQGRRHRHSRR